MVSDHLPECYLSGPPSLCPMCEALRACEQRVTHKEFLLDEGDPYREVYRAGYRKGLAAAREVVSWTQDIDDALDAINALADMDDPREPLGMSEPPPLPPSQGVPTTPMWPLRGEHE